MKEVKVEQNKEAQGKEEEVEEEVEEVRTGWTNVDQQGAVMLCHIVWSHKLLFMFNSSKARNEWRKTYFLFQAYIYIYVVKIYSPSFDKVSYRAP